MDTRRVCVTAFHSLIRLRRAGDPLNKASDIMALDIPMLIELSVPVKWEEWWVWESAHVFYLKITGGLSLSGYVACGSEQWTAHF